jgi:hypothetical protein
MTAMYWPKHVADCMCEWKLYLKGLCYTAGYVGNSSNVSGIVSTKAKIYPEMYIYIWKHSVRTAQ